MIRINSQLSIDDDEIQWRGIRSQGAGGQNVNKVSSAIHLRFDIRASRLPESVKRTLLERTDSRLNRDGVIVIKAQQHRQQQKNLDAAKDRLARLIRQALHQPAARIATRPTRSSVKKRLDSKTRHSALKRSRGRIDFD